MADEYQIIIPQDGRSRYYENGVLKSIDGILVVEGKSLEAESSITLETHIDHSINEAEE